MRKMFPSPSPWCSFHVTWLPFIHTMPFVMVIIILFFILEFWTYFLSKNQEGFHAVHWHRCLAGIIALWSTSTMFWDPDEGESPCSRWNYILTRLLKCVLSNGGLPLPTDPLITSLASKKVLSMGKRGRDGGWCLFHIYIQVSKFPKSCTCKIGQMIQNFSWLERISSRNLTINLVNENILWFWRLPRK